EQAVHALIEAWQRLLASIRPDLIISDYAPIAALTARGRIPLALIGNGFTLPPAELEKFPILHEMSLQTWAEDRLLEIVNSSARAFGLQTLERLPQLFAGDIRWVQTFPLLDPYRLWREHPVEGPMIDRLPDARRSDAREILVYISSRLSMRPRILETLAPVAERVRVFAPAM